MPEIPERPDRPSTRGGGHQQAYCAASGVLATALATAASFTVSGTAAQLTVWAGVLVAVCAAAGLAYGHGPFNPQRAAQRRGRRRA